MFDHPRRDKPHQDQQAAIIRLDDFLKTMGVVATGGEAKIRIQAGQVTVNGDVETRRRKQLVAGDVVVFQGEVFQVTTPS
jgi:ribosome-associated protein